jgi:3-hydroxyisobutyrate dehydrogenase
MGAAMAANVARAGFALTVWNRTPGRAEAVLASGATEAGSPAAVAGASDVVVICVSDTPDVEAVLFGEDGLSDGLARGALVIDCSTIAPGASREFAARLAGAGVSFVDAPVSGGSEGARAGSLTIMVGGSDEDVARATPVLESMGTAITHMGPVGSGQVTKASARSSSPGSTWVWPRAWCWP